MVGNQISIKSQQTNQESPAWKTGPRQGSDRAKKMVSMVGDLCPIECLQDYQDSPALNAGTNISTSPRHRQSSVRAQLMVSMVGNQCRIESPQIIQQSPALGTGLNPRNKASRNGIE
eukprot:CAMPEP_0179409470 /NCGR_PEP_ID=MMETSP0799-20121207/2721_1 /TAXON_ID=46947 /ORGANISM="Geminigera cryophila, Strain CCMP2564" /LENGTH=116 /DNA_ID=CAMNT_0021181155 /DNA_START=598 /DNA_END=948 /DNA_ORIENTATION=+